MCDKSSEAIKYVTSNVNKTHLQENAVVINKDYNTALKNFKDSNIKFDIIFLDPPYDSNFSKDAVELIIEYKLLNDGGIIIIETDEKERDIESLKNTNVEVYDTRKYGRANLIFLIERG